MATAPQYQFTLPTSAATDALGEALAPFVEDGDFLALWGDLGSGKTAFARALIRARQKKAGTECDEVQSPTFTLVQAYEAGDLLISHYDFYRIESELELQELGVDDALDQGVVLAEWPERLGAAIYPDRLDVRLNHVSEGRLAMLTGYGVWHRRLQAIIESGCCDELEHVA